MTERLTFHIWDASEQFYRIGKLPILVEITIILSVLKLQHYSCCPVTQSCLTLCDPVDGSMPDLPVLHPLSEFALTHVH